MFKLIFLGWLTGVILSLTTAALGSFVLWRRIASFGDTLSHSSILGIAISIIFNINSFFSLFLLMSILAIILAWLETLLPFAIDTILNIISHSTLSLGIILMSIISNNHRIDVTHYLFGDLLAVTKYDLIIIVINSIIILSILYYYWNYILSATINEELAQADGINIFYARLIIMLIIALNISISIKFVGALLITSLLIIPPATAQHFSNSPENMVIISILVSIISVTGGIIFSFYAHTPTSPSIVLFSSFLCLISNIRKYFFYK
ncbi:metal ABC transporter permease [Buchnera aphidicola]|uniref:metal ABC transporter permease n=1 Tax=Buchnera aphidicola TaxID=9 RepID=UPI003CE4C052